MLRLICRFAPFFALPEGEKPAAELGGFKEVQDGALRAPEVSLAPSNPPPGSTPGARLAPVLPGSADNKLRRQSQEAADLLARQAHQKAQSESARTGRTVQPEKTPTVDQIMAQARGEGEAITTDPAFHRGPNTADLRPGESLLGLPHGDLAKARPVPEHMLASTLTVSPTLNAAGLGADSGLKLTPDNVDARAGAEGHKDGPDPADKVRSAANPNAFTGIPGVHAAERTDTREAQLEQRAEAPAPANVATAEKANEAVAAQEEANRAAGAGTGEGLDAAK